MSTIFVFISFVGVIWFLQLVAGGLQNPLAKIPGPWYTRWTHYVMKWHVLAGDRFHYVHALHKKYGPVVRVQPDEVSVIDLDGSAIINKVGSGYVKAPWYDMMVAMETGLFAEKDVKRHGARRRLLSHAFSRSNLQTQWLPEIKDKVFLAVSKIKAEAEQGEADLLKWWTLMTQDVIAHLSFGESFHMIEQGKQTDYIDAIQNSVLALVIRWEFPLIHPLLPYIPSAAVQKIVSAVNIVLEHSKIAVRNLREAQGQSKSLLAGMFAEYEAGSKESREAAITIPAIQSEAVNFIVAGSDTTAVALTYLIWAVLKEPELQKALEAEVAKLSPELGLDELNNAPLLNSVIQETMRMYLPIPGALPRLVPKEGAEFAGHFVPGGYVVSNQCYSVQRNPTWFPNPDTFDGYRFIDQGKMTPEQKTAMAPLGSGSRICIGIHLAMIEIQLGAACFFRQCAGSKLSPSVTDESMVVEERFFGAPKAHAMNVTLAN